MANRDRYDLMHAVLHLLVGGPQSNVDLIYGCHFSNTQSHAIIGWLMKQGLIAEYDMINQRSQHYKITSKGMEILRIIDELHTMIPELIAEKN